MLLPVAVKIIGIIFFHNYSPAFSVINTTIISTTACPMMFTIFPTMHITPLLIDFLLVSLLNHILSIHSFQKCAKKSPLYPYTAHPKRIIFLHCFITQLYWSNKFISGNQLKRTIPTLIIILSLFVTYTNA